MDTPAFVDTHIHLFDLKHPELEWSWLGWDAVHPDLGNIDAMKSVQYPLEAFVAESRFSSVSKAVHVQAAIGSPDPVAETRWLQQASDKTGFPLGIVGHANLKDPAVEGVLEQHRQFPGMRGIRDFSEGDYLIDPAFHRGYALLAKYELSCDLDCQWQNMGKARDLARKFPDVMLILDHAGFPQERTDEYFDRWMTGMRTLAEAENVVCKISGLGMKDMRWTVDSLRRWVIGCIETFGVDRCFFGSNWPLDRLSSSYPDVVEAYREIIGDLSAHEQTALLSGNAERSYRM
jgi:predicted TIM-barrel fold metal-dependent hydrolase